MANTIDQTRVTQSTFGQGFTLAAKAPQTAAIGTSAAVASFASRAAVGVVTAQANQRPGIQAPQPGRLPPQRVGGDGVPTLPSGALRTGNAEVDSVPLLPPQRGEQMADAGKGGFVMRRVRHAGIWWNFGVGDADEQPNRPSPLTGAELRRNAIPHMKPGDVILMGAGGNVTHAGIYVGNGKIVHSMATERTQRSNLQRFGDLLIELPSNLGELTGLKKKRQGVFSEGVDEFADRFYRDSYVVLRSPEMTPEAARKGIARVNELIGTGYDWDLVPGNDTYYCSEVVAEFYRAALGNRSPRISARPHKEHGKLMDRDGIVDPLDFLQSPDLNAILTNRAARNNYPVRLRHLRPRN